MRKTVSMNTHVKSLFLSFLIAGTGAALITPTKAHAISSKTVAYFVYPTAAITTIYVLDQIYVAGRKKFRRTFNETTKQVKALVKEVKNLTLMSSPFIVPGLFWAYSQRYTPSKSSTPWVYAVAISALMAYEVITRDALERDAKNWKDFKRLQLEKLAIEAKQTALFAAKERTDDESRDRVKSKDTPGWFDGWFGGGGGGRDDADDTTGGHVPDDAGDFSGDDDSDEDVCPITGAHGTCPCGH